MTDDIRTAASRIIPRLESAAKELERLLTYAYPPDKASFLLEQAAHGTEDVCIELRNLCEKERVIKEKPMLSSRRFEHKELFGEITRTDGGWIDICLFSLLPHCKAAGGTRYVSDSITRLLNSFRQNGGELPMFSNAFMAIVEHCSKDTAQVFDNDNKGFKAVINALKGRLFADDNQFELSLGLFTRRDENICCHIYVMPTEDAGDFLYLLNDGSI